MNNKRKMKKKKRESGGGVSSSMIYLIYCKNFSNATMCPHLAQQLKRKSSLYIRDIRLLSKVHSLSLSIVF
jgi:hypothetical protein